MKLIPVKKLLYGIFLISTLLLLQSNLFSQEVIELKLSHFGPPVWPIHKNALVPWTEKVQEESNGRIHFTVYPKGSLGKGAELYDYVTQGKTDIAVSITEYTPGRFPLSSCVELPFLGAQSAEGASLVYWNLYQKHLQDEFKETKILWLFCHGPAHLHTVSKPVKTLEDLKGLRIRANNPLIAHTLELLGAEPVICTAVEGYELLKEGKLDGAAITWEAVIAFKYSEFCQYHTEINMYVLPFFAAMNQDKYDSLDPEIKAILDNTTGEHMASACGKVMDAADEAALEQIRQRGDQIYTLSQDELERWKQTAMRAGDAWVQQMQKKGQPGLEVLRDALDLFDQIHLHTPADSDDSDEPI